MPSTIVVILGMHRSGTSCLTELLQKSGLHLGTGLMNHRDAANLRGHFEAWEAVRINDRILEISGGAWDRVPTRLSGDESTHERMRRFLEGLGVRPVAGWKDPRTTITLPLWKPHLTNYRIVACFRHPRSVARSLEVRGDCTAAEGEDLWIKYNECLLRQVETESKEVFWFDFDSPAEEFAATVAFLCRQLDLDFNPWVLQGFNPYLQHQKRPEGGAELRALALYERLRTRFRHQVSKMELHAGEGARPSGAVDPLGRANRRCDELQQQLGQLAEVQQLQNEAQQRFTRVQVSLEQYPARLHTEQRRQFDHLRMEIEEHLKKLSAPRVLLQFEQLRREVQDLVEISEFTWAQLDEVSQALVRLEHVPEEPAVHDLEQDWATARSVPRDSTEEEISRPELPDRDTDLRVLTRPETGRQLVLSSPKSRHNILLRLRTLEQALTLLRTSYGELSARVAECHPFVATLRRSWPFRLRRWLASRLRRLRMAGSKATNPALRPNPSLVPTDAPFTGPAEREVA